MRKTHKQKQKKKGVQLERLLLDNIPQTPVPAPYFTIPSPDPYRFPLGETLLEGIKLLENYFPEDVNQIISTHLGNANVERVSRYQDTYCMLGKNGKGLIIGKRFLNFDGVTAFSYGANYLLVAFQDLRLEVYSSQDLKLIKLFKRFFAANNNNKPITFLKLLSVPKGYQGIVFLSHDGQDIYIHRLEKSLISKLSSKIYEKIIKNLEYPVTQILQMPKMFKHYLNNDIQYRDCSLLCIGSVNRIDILKINHFRLDFERFWDVVLTKRVEELGTNTVSWGETVINAPSRELQGSHLVLVCSFANTVIFLALKEIKKFQSNGEEIQNKFEWVESYQFTLQDRAEVAFCQFVKKNEIILITDQNTVMIWNTKSFDIFEKPIESSNFQIFTEIFHKKLISRIVKTVEIAPQKVQRETTEAHSTIATNRVSKKREARSHLGRMSSSQWDNLSKEETESDFSEEPGLSFLNTIPQEEEQPRYKHIRTFADSFTYEYPSTEIFYMSETSENEKNSFGVYVYCDWKLISDLLRLDRKYDECMLFLIAIYKRANKFDLGVTDREEEVCKYIQDLSLEYIAKQVSKLRHKKSLNANMELILEQEEHFKTLIKPIEFLCETSQFTFLFQVAQEHIISNLIIEKAQLPYQKQYSRNRDVFFTALIKFIEHGRISYIPETHIQLVLDYYLSVDRADVIDRLAIYFDLEKVDTGIVVQCLLQNDLTVSLAHICIQGNENLFVTPFVKFWGVSANYKHHGQIQNAMIYAVRALWYVKLCLQRNWALKQYSFERYSKMISILSHHFLSEKIVVTMLEIRPQQCLETLNYYFNAENSMVVNEAMQLNLQEFQKKECNWIQKREGSEKLQNLLIAIYAWIQKANKKQKQQSKIRSSEEQIVEVGRKYDTVSPRIKMNLFLSNIIIYRTVKFTDEKYFEIICDLIENYEIIQEIKYGLEDQHMVELQEQYQYEENFSQKEIDEILASRYLIRVLTLIYYERRDFIKNRLISIYEKSREHRLMDLQAEICLLNGQFGNAVDIYLYAKFQLRGLIFEFLENSFKNLVLEKRRNDKKRLGDILTAKIKSLVELNSTKTKNIVDTYLPEIQERLIQEMADDKYLQLGYLEQIINNSESMRTFGKRRLSDKSILRYVELMSEIKPDELLDAFKSNSYFPIDESIKICELNNAYDCLEYLYEKEGSSVESVKVSMKRIAKILKIRISNDSDELMEENMTIYVKVKEILDHAIEVCKNSRTEQTWEALLDTSIELYHRFLQEDFPEDEIEIFFFINGEIMEHLASNCPIEHTIDLLQNKYQNLNMGGKMTRAFITILANLSHSINILYIAENMIERSYHHLLVKDYFNKISGVGGQGQCQACEFGIMRRKKSKHFPCHHSYHNQCIIQQSPVGCVYCLLNQLDQFEFHINSMYSSPLHPKLKKMNEIFAKFNQQQNNMSILLEEEDRIENEKNEGNVVISNAEKKREKFKDFDQLMVDRARGDERVLRELRMY